MQQDDMFMQQRPGMGYGLGATRLDKSLGQMNRQHCMFLQQSGSHFGCVLHRHLISGCWVAWPAIRYVVKVTLQTIMQPYKTACIASVNSRGISTQLLSRGVGNGGWEFQGDSVINA